MMTNGMQWAAGLLAASMMFIGCGGGMVRSNNVGGGGGGGNAVVRVVNNSNTTICYIHVSPASESTWNTAQDALGSSVISSGSAFDFSIPAGTWDIMLEACGEGRGPLGHPQLYAGQHSVDGGQAYVLTYP